jgi:hypothetical protein
MPTSRSHAPDTMNRNDAIIPTPTAYRPQVCPKNRITAPVCSMIRQAQVVDLDDRRALAALPHWLNSAEWRGLVVHDDTSTRLPRIFTLGPKAQAHLLSAA